MVSIDIKLTDNQKKALEYLLDNTYRCIWFGWWAWWGKTFLWVVWIWHMCIQYPWVRYAVMRDTIQSAKRTTLVTFEKFYDIYHIPAELRWKWNEQKSTITFKNGSVVIFLEGCYYPSDPLYNRFGSLELTWAFIEESAECPLDWINILKTRVWRHYNDKYWIKPKVLETFNPNPWHVYERYYKWNWWPDSIFVESLVYSNQFIDKDYITWLENSDESIKKRLLYGQWDFEDWTWMMFKKSDIDKLRLNKEQMWKYYIICDVARFWEDTTRISLWNGNTWKRTWTYEKNTVQQCIHSILYIASQYWVEHENIIIDADWVGWGVVDWITYSKWFINNARPIVTKAKQNYANLRSQCAFELKRRVENWEIRIDWDYDNKAKDWDKLTQEMLNTYIDEKSIDWKTKIESKEKMKERTWHSPDLLDTMIMRMYPYVLGDEWIPTEPYLDYIER